MDCKGKSCKLKEHMQFIEDSYSLFGGERARTAALLHAKQALSQLSYTPSYPLKYNRKQLIIKLFYRLQYFKMCIDNYLFYFIIDPNVKTRG
jgi:hypothetical protein